MCLLTSAVLFLSIQELARQALIDTREDDIFDVIDLHGSIGDSGRKATPSQNTSSSRSGGSGQTQSSTTPHRVVQRAAALFDVRTPVGSLKKRPKGAEYRSPSVSGDSDDYSSSDDDNDNGGNRADSPLAFNNRHYPKLNMPKKRRTTTAQAFKNKSSAARVPAASMVSMVGMDSGRYLATLQSRKTKAQNDQYSGSIDPRTNKVLVARKGRHEEDEDEDDDGSVDLDSEENYSDEDGDF